VAISINICKEESTGFALLREEQLKALSPQQRERVNELQKEYTGDAETTANAIRLSGVRRSAFLAMFQITRQPDN
jgi:hypothetical protein